MVDVDVFLTGRSGHNVTAKRHTIYGRFGHLSTKIDENTNSNYSFNFQYIEILSYQTLDNSHSDLLIRQILVFWEIE